MNFFKPEVMFQISDGGTSGYTVGECPILYYFIAILWKVFGYSDFTYRLLNTIIFFVGLVALYKTAFHFLKNHFWSTFIPILLFTSPVVTYYAANYLTDTTAIALILIGWNYIIKFICHNKNRTFYTAFFFFTIAGLIKVTALLSVMALLGIILYSTIKKNNRFFPTNLKFDIKKGIVVTMMFGIIIAWYLFAINYNKSHKAYAADGNTYFSTNTFPIWNLDKQDIIDITHEITNHWSNEYYHYSVYFLFLALFLVFTFFIKKTNPFLTTITMLVLGGTILFCLLWYFAFAQHDYYIINLLILPVFMFIAVLEFLNRTYPKISNSLLTKVALSILLLFNINYAKGKLKERYLGEANEYKNYKDVHSITPYLRELGIHSDDKVISLPDHTPCYTLYLMNQPGWSQINFRNDSAQVKEYIQLGAKYLILTDAEPLTRACLQPFLKNKIGEFGKVKIFKLQ
jgi:4-amino-4-deoxy-L-arabinose transferase-like glycosyltransferase